MRKERAAIDQLAPDRYILATSVPMTGKRKGELAAIIGPALRTSDDILGAEDLNGLPRSWPEVETAHVNLWLSSAAAAPASDPAVRYFASYGGPAQTNNRLLDGFEGKLTNAKWAALSKTSSDTALRDISDLLNRGILTKDEGGGRSTSYSLAGAERMPVLSTKSDANQPRA